MYVKILTKYCKNIVKLLSKHVRILSQYYCDILCMSKYCNNIVKNCQNMWEYYCSIIAIFYVCQNIVKLLSKYVRILSQYYCDILCMSKYCKNMREYYPLAIFYVCQNGIRPLSIWWYCSIFPHRECTLYDISLYVIEYMNI